jgi:hypothetical protein
MKTLKCNSASLFLSTSYEERPTSALTFGIVDERQDRRMTHQFFFADKYQPAGGYQSNAYDS